MIWVEELDDHVVGVKRFDTLSVPEKLGILEYVARCLLVKRVKAPVITAIAEAAIAAIYAQVILEVEIEIDEGSTDNRRLVRKACVECGLRDDVPNVSSEHLIEWRGCLDRLENRIFWDADWEEDIIEPDDPPEKANAFRELFGLHDDYYVAVAPDPNPQQLLTVRKRLKRLASKQ